MTGDRMRCPECDNWFDAAAAGGWCTNPYCGEFKAGPDALTPQVRVQCPICRTQYDPTANDRWCTNCGRYRAFGRNGAHTGSFDEAVPDGIGEDAANTLVFSDTPDDADADEAADADGDDAGYCPHCGTDLSRFAGSDFCASCGEPVYK